VQTVEAICDVVAHREGLELSKFGNAAYFYFLTQENNLTPEKLKAISRSCFKYALQNRNIKLLPLGLFNGVYAYPFICTASVSPEIAQLAETYKPSHWSALEFPVVLDLSTERVHCFGGTPIWGAAYYRRNRQFVDEMAAPLKRKA
jgi:hypothetical protein